MPQLQLPIFPQGLTSITEDLAFQREDGMVVYFHGLLPVFQHAEKDLKTFRMYTSQLVANKTVRQQDIVRAFGAESRPNVAIVFQSFALFPWLTVAENVEVPLLARGMTQADRRRKAHDTLDSVGLKGFENAYPKELSGGMKQRVGRSEERRVGKECRSRWVSYQKKK